MHLHTLFRMLVYFLWALHGHAIPSPKSATTSFSVALTRRHSVPGVVSKNVRTMDGSNAHGIRDTLAGNPGIVSVGPAYSLYGGALWTGNVTVGGQEFTLFFDTGSAWLWVKGTSTDFKEPHKIYDYTKSKTFDLVSSEPQVWSYTSSNASTKVRGTEQVAFGSAKVPKQMIAVVDKCDALDLAGVDGVIGLEAGWQGNPKDRPSEVAWPKTFLENVKGSLDLPVLAMDLRHDGSGFFIFGNFNMTAFKGKLATTKILVSQGWATTLPRFQIGNGPIQSTGSGSWVLMDTGTSNLAMNEAIVKQYWSQVPNSWRDGERGGFNHPCNAQLPDLHVEIAPGYMAQIPRYLLKGHPNQGRDCSGFLQSIGEGHRAIMGVPLFNAQYTVFNIEDRTLFCGASQSLMAVGIGNGWRYPR